MKMPARRSYRWPDPNAERRWTRSYTRQHQPLQPAPLLAPDDLVQSASQPQPAASAAELRPSVVDLGVQVTAREEEESGSDASGLAEYDPVLEEKDEKNDEEEDEVSFNAVEDSIGVLLSEVGAAADTRPVTVDLTQVQPPVIDDGEAAADDSVIWSSPRLQTDETGQTSNSAVSGDDDASDTDDVTLADRSPADRTHADESSRNAENGRAQQQQQQQEQAGGALLPDDEAVTRSDDVAVSRRRGEVPASAGADQCDAVDPAWWPDTDVAPPTSGAPNEPSRDVNVHAAAGGGSNAGQWLEVSASSPRTSSDVDEPRGMEVDASQPTTTTVGDAGSASAPSESNKR